MLNYQRASGSTSSFGCVSLLSDLTLYRLLTYAIGRAEGPLGLGGSLVGRGHIPMVVPKFDWQRQGCVSWRRFSVNEENVEKTVSECWNRKHGVCCD